MTAIEATAPNVRWCTQSELYEVLMQPRLCRDLFGQPSLLHDILRWMRHHPEECLWYQPARLTIAGYWVAAGGFKGPPRHGNVEIGYRVHPDHRRQGHASTLTRWLCEQAAERGVQRVLAVTATDNRASQGVLAHNGFVHTGDFLGDSQNWLQRWQYRVPTPWPPAR